METDRDSQELRFLQVHRFVELFFYWVAGAGALREAPVLGLKSPGLREALQPWPLHFKEVMALSFSRRYLVNALEFGSNGSVARFYFEDQDVMRLRDWLTPFLVMGMLTPHAGAEGDWEITPQSEQALEQGLNWLAKNQGREGNWECNDLGLVSMGAMAFLAAGHLPGRGKYGDHVNRALQYVAKHAKPSGLLNAADGQRDMYNHGLAAFVLGQAYGMTDDPQIGKTLEKSLKLIANTQCDDGGWDYRARRQPHGHDLSLVVMQAKALRSAVDSGFEVRGDVIRLAIQSVRQHYKAENGARGDEELARQGPGQFTYDGHRGTVAMAACGVVCLQEFGQYDDWRIPKNMDLISKEVAREVMRLAASRRNGEVPFDAYTLYYVGQAIYQVGGDTWKSNYPPLRDQLVQSQVQKPESAADDGAWRDTRWVHGKPGQLYGTSVGCFLLAIPNRYLPILQEGKIQSLKDQLSEK